MSSILPGAVLSARQPDEGSESAWNTVKVVGVSGEWIGITPTTTFDRVEALTVSDVLSLYELIQQGPEPRPFETPIEELIG